jgi:hypothetical protein
MPTISLFYGIVIQMFALDQKHHNSPHIHVRYSEHKASICIPDGELLSGSLPSRQMKLVQAWIELHQEDLMADWSLAVAGQTPMKIEPLR